MPSRNDERLALFRSEWPRHVSWREVREAEPRVFTQAALGALLLVLAAATTVLFFIERAKKKSGRLGKIFGSADEKNSLFMSHFALLQGSDWSDPPLQIGLARYSGGKSDAKGPKEAFRFLDMRLPRILPHW